MTRARAFAVVILLASAAAACRSKGAEAPKPPLPPPTPAEVVEAIGARVEQYRQGYEVRSLEALAPLYSPTDDLLLVAQGRPHRGFMAVQEYLAGFFTAVETVRLRLTDVQIVALGDAGAVATAAVHRTYGDGVTTVDERGTLTLVFRRVDGDWRIVGEHYSYAPGMP